MNDTRSCAREVDDRILDPCPTCGAMTGEDCPYGDISPELSEGAPITAGSAGECDGDDGVCESCQ